MKTRKVLSIILILAIVFTLIPKITTQASTTIKIGDYVRMGKYYDESIRWRCVDIDENGPLMLADRILTIKPFDAAGNHKYLDGTAQADYINRRTLYGSNLWETSSIRSWLNSSATAGNVIWLDGCPPTEDKVYNGWNDYATEKGFLAEGNFTVSEQNAIKSVTQKSLLNELDVTKLKVGGTDIYSYSPNIFSVTQNYDTAFYQNVTDKMFLLDVKQINKVYQNGNILGAEYFTAELTTNAEKNSEDKLWFWKYTWGSTLRSPCASSIYSNNIFGIINSVPHHGSSYNGEAYSCSGIRPSFYIDMSSVNFESGNGEIGTPFVVSGGATTPPTTPPTATPTPRATPTEIPAGATIISVGNVYGLADNNVNVSVYISENSGLAATSFYLNYDTSKLEVLSAKKGIAFAASASSVYINDINGTIGCGFAIDGGTLIGGSILDVTFKIKSTSTGTIPLKLDVDEVIDDYFVDIIYGITQGSITVGTAPTPTPNPEPTVEPAPTSVLGDVTGEGKVLSTDALKILQSISGNVVLTNTQKLNADVTKNGYVQSSDALMVLQFCCGKITEF